MTTRTGAQWSLSLALGVLAFIVLLPLAQEHANAQAAGATLSGSITDPSGSFVPGALVAVTNTATGVTTNVKSNSAGFFIARNLLPGPYEVTISASGFRKVSETGITLTVGAQQVLNRTMTVGATTQTVNVTGAPPEVDLATSSITDTVGATAIRQLPLNGRDWTTLAALQPGVNSLGSAQYSNFVTGFVRGNRGLGLQLAVSGARPQLNDYRIDGITVNDYTNGGPGSVQGGTLGVEGIQEFSVITSNYTAEFGRTAGGVINAITRSGTNQIHGSAYEFLRNDVLDAANFFDNYTNSPKPPYRQNQFGAAAGGPIRKDRNFYFFNYEGLRTSQSSTVLANVPSPDARNGILHNSDGSTCTIGVFRAPGTLSSTDPGCNYQNSEGTVGVDPKVVPYLALYGLPNQGLYPSQNTGIYSFTGVSKTDENFYTGRFDNTFSTTDSMFASMEYDHATLTLPDSMNDISNLSVTTRTLIAFEETHIFSPKLANTFRAGYSRSFAEAPPPLAINPAAAATTDLGPATGAGTPNLFVGELTEATGAGSATVYIYPYNSFQYSDDAFLTRGKHDLKFGVAVEQDQFNPEFLSAAGGTFTFPALANFLEDAPSAIRTGTLSSPLYGIPKFYWRQSIPAVYVQDNIRWRPNLTINLGLRYEMATVPRDRFNKEASLHSATDLAPTVGAPFFSNPTYRNFAPRVGFAWDPFSDGKTSIRGAFGIFDILPLISEVTYKDGQSSPFNEQGNGSNLPLGSFPSAAFGLTAVKSKLRTYYIQQKPKADYDMTWNLNIERQLTPNISVLAAYVGSHGVHEPFAIDDMNDVLPTTTPIGLLWPYPVGSGNQLNSAPGTKVSRIDHLEWTNSTLFDAFEFQVTKRMSRGIQVQGSYTWSKAIDGGDGINIGDPFGNSISSLFFFDIKQRRGLADFNVAHNLVANFDWQIPSPNRSHGFATEAIGGWQLGGIVTFKTGEPFTPNLAGSGNGAGGDPLGLNNSDPFDYPNLITTGNCHSPVNPGSVANYFKLNCFTLPTAPASYAALCGDFPGAATPAPTGSVYCANLLGNERRNSVIGPGLVDFDFSVVKDFPITRISESFNVQFRSEFFNVLNHSNFSSPIDNSNIFDTTGAPVGGAGLIDQTSTSNRETQFSLKVIW